MISKELPKYNLSSNISKYYNLINILLNLIALIKVCFLIFILELVIFSKDFIAIFKHSKVEYGFRRVFSSGN